MQKKINFHFSVDDVLKSLIEVSDKKIKLKDHWFFLYLYKIYLKYNVKISLYLFFEENMDGKKRNLTHVRNLKNELNENWLYFGAHSLNYDKPLHSQTVLQQKNDIKKIYKEIIRFAGKELLASKVRLHQYSECYEIKDILKTYNIKYLFTTDKNVGAHRLESKNKKDLLLKGFTKYKGVNFIRTDLRVEDMISKSFKKNIIDIKKIIKKKNFLIIYTHEYELKKIICRTKFTSLLNLIATTFKLKSY